MVLKNLYQRLARVASSLPIRNMTIDEVLRVFEERDAQHLSGRLRLPQETSNVSEYFDAMGVRFIADPDDGIKYGILLDGRVPQTLSGEGASPVAIYGGYFQMPPQDIFLDDYCLAFSNRAELRQVVPKLRTTKVYDIQDILPYVLTATLGDGTKIEARAVEAIGKRGLTTKDSYTLSVK